MMKLNPNMKTLWGKLLGVGLGLLTVSLFAQPVITNQPTSQAVIYGGNATFSVMVTGVGPFTYQWQFNGTNLTNNAITTVAGSGISGFAGDGGAATNAKIYCAGISVDTVGNFYIADYINNRIRRVDTNGKIITVAGTNSGGFAGDSGAANGAKLNAPYGVALDGVGNYFIADEYNNRIRKVDTNGIITTVAGSGTAGFGGDGGAATSANLYSPSGVALDAIGNLFIADTSNNRIRKVDTNGNISTIAGTNAAGFSGDGGPAKVAKLNAPQGVAVDNFGNIFIADYYNNRIRRVDTNGTITTFAGSNFNGFGGDGGLAVSARLSNPMGVVVDSFGYVFFSDYHNNRIRQVDMNSIITTVAGNGSALFSGDGGAATNAGLFQPYGVTIETDGSLLITDMLDYCVRRAAMGRIPMLKFNGVTTNNAGNYQVIVSSPSGSVTSSVVSLTVGFGPSIVTQPQNTLAISGNPASFGLTASGNLPLGYQWYWNNNGLANGTNSSLNFPATTTGQAGNYFCVVTNSYGSITSTVVSMMVATPPSIVIQPTNQIILTGSNVTFGVVASGTGPLNYQWQLNGTNLPNNTIITTVAGIGIYATTNNGGYAGDGGPATNARLSSPYDVAVDAYGNLFIADYGNNRVRKVDTNGIITTVAGSGSLTSSGDGGPATNAGFNYISAVALDVSNNLLIAEMDAGKVRKVDANGNISTVAGSGASGNSGDGGAATNARMYLVTGIAEDAFGNLFIADTGSHNIRKVNVNGIISTLGSVNSQGVATDSSGNVYIADGGGNVYRVDTQSNLTTLATGFNSADGVAISWNNSIFIADHGNEQVKQVDTNGNVSLLVGKRTITYYGDGGLATNAGIGPYSIATDAAGNLFIADRDNCRIRKVNLAGSPNLTLTSVTPSQATLAYSPPTNSAYLSLNGTNPASAGNFSVVVTSPYGSVTSSIASLIVLVPPSITNQPANIAVTNGGFAGFNVGAYGTAPLSYQWFTSSGRTATAEPVMGVFSVSSVKLLEGGAGYVSVPNVQFISNFGSGASATAVVTNGSVTGFSRNPGGYYTYPNAPTILIDNPTGTSNQALIGQTNGALNLSAVTSVNTTNYFVVITNNYGSVTSSMAGLWVFVPPQNFSASGNASTNGNQLSLQLAGTPGYPYILQSATNLMPPVNWQSVLTNLADTNGNWSFTVTNLSAAPNLYYRAVVQ